MGRASIFLMILTFIFIILFIIYGVFSSRMAEFNLGTNTNFSLNNSLNPEMQFYPNMRFPSSNISYRIERNCTLEKKKDILEAFKIYWKRLKL